MRTNLWRTLAVPVFAGALALTAAPRDAEAVSLNLINTWEMGDYVSFGKGFDGYLGAPAFGKGGIPMSGINLHFGVGFAKGDQVLPYIGLSMVRSSYETTYLADSDDEDAVLDALDPDDTGAALQFGIQIGAKFFFIERSKGKAPPFINIAFEKYIGNIVDDDDYRAPPGVIDPDWDPDDSLDFTLHDQALLSPTGFRFAFGAEYYFNDNFSLGGEFFGLQFHWAQADNRADINRRDLNTRFALYTSLHLTYRFSFTVRASVQFESDYDYED